ncbi:MAG: TAXI family TRAP transporter solute-binding subunit [Oscillospiraceae bacterium]
MKKALALILALLMVLSLCACGSSGSSSSSGSAPSSGTSGAASGGDASGSAPSGDSDSTVTADLTVGTGGAQGTYYGFTNILSTVVGQKTGVNMTVVETGGSKDNLVNMAQGVYDMATVQSDVMTYAYYGTNSFADTGALDGFRVLCALYPETVQIITTDPSIKSVSDLMGKSVCVGDVGSGTYFNAVDVFAAYGMTIDDVKPVYQSFGDSTESLKDGKIDAAFLCAGAPTPAVSELAASQNVYVISIDDEHMEKLLADCPWYASITLPAGTYEGFDEDAVTITVKATLVCDADTPDDVAYTIVKTIFENVDEIAALHEKGNSLSLEFATEGIAVPFAAGAAQYFAENGITVETAD